MSLTTALATRPDRCPDGYAPVQHPSLCACTDAPAAADDWSIFKAALEQCAKESGEVHACDMRRLVTGRIAPKTIAAFYSRARSRAEGLLAEAGHERSNDERGRNAGRMEPFYTYLPARADRAVA